MSSTDSIPLVINTMGWAKGLGACTLAGRRVARGKIEISTLFIKERSGISLTILIVGCDHLMVLSVGIKRAVRRKSSNSNFEKAVVWEWEPVGQSEAGAGLQWSIT